jgi:hypothetical protein
MMITTVTTPMIPPTTATARMDVGTAAMAAVPATTPAIKPTIVVKPRTAPVADLSADAHPDTACPG